MDDAGGCAVNNINISVLVDALSAIRSVRAYDDAAKDRFPQALWHQVMVADVRLSAALDRLENVKVEAQS